MTPPMTEAERLAGELGRVQREVDCPRCHEKCGWCGDSRHMHGTLKLPGFRRKCTVPGYEPEGDACPLCGGHRRVIATTTYTPVAHLLRQSHAQGEG